MKPLSFIETAPVFADTFPDSGLNSKKRTQPHEVVPAVRLTDLIGPGSYGQKPGTKDGLKIQYGPFP